MAKYSVNTCPLCEQPVSKEVDGRIVEEIIQVNGVVVTIGKSIGGWGARETPVDYSEKICKDCFDELGRLLGPAVDFLRNNKRRESNKASMRPDQSSPGGCEAPLLRKVPQIFGWVK